MNSEQARAMKIIEVTKKAEQRLEGRHFREKMVALFVGGVSATGVFLGGEVGDKTRRLLNENYSNLPVEVRAFDCSPKDGYFSGEEVYQFLRAYEIKKRD